MIEDAEFELFDRGLREATFRHSGAALDESLAALGWHDALAVDQRRAVSLLFEHQGLDNSTSSAIDLLLIKNVGQPEGSKTSVVLPALGPQMESGFLLDGRCIIHGLATPRLGRCDLAIAIARSDGRHLAIAVDTASLSTCAVKGLDPAAGLFEVNGELDLAEAGWTVSVDWRSAVGVGQLALGHELVGTARAMLALAREHSLDRIQFARPISSFQAVRHRLADSLVAVEAADALLAAAWDDRTSSNATIAKAFAGRAAELTGRHCQQVLAGVGFTRDHPFHRYLRRAMLLNELLGAEASLSQRLGADAIETRHLPPVVAL